MLVHCFKIYKKVSSHVESCINYIPFKPKNPCIPSRILFTIQNDHSNFRKTNPRSVPKIQFIHSMQYLIQIILCINQKIVVIIFLGIIYYDRHIRNK